MKYFVMLCDGMADEPSEKLGGKTPMMLANKPTIDLLASKGEVGLVKTVQEGMKPGSDVANLSVLGYNSADCYTGRSPLEAASIGIDLKDTDVTLRCNLVTLSDEENYEDKRMVDYCGGDISTPEARELVEYLEEKLGNDEFKFYAGVAYRHCLVWDNGNPNPGVLTPPHDIPGKVIAEYIPKGDDTAKLYDIMKKSYDLLKDHPVNKKRVAEGKRPANSAWFWGEGTKPQLANFSEKTGLKGSMISAVDLLKGIAICADMTSVDVDGATGYIDTNFEGKCKAAIDEFKRGQDFVYVHVEAPDECGHRAEAENKVKAIELIDEKILKPVVEFLRDFDDFAVLICPDHPTPINIQTHTSDPVPYVIYDSKNEKDSGVKSVNEDTAKATGNYIEKGYTMMDYFLSK
ncbi:MAG: cofactor-independent phosphoglycerate mutase [Ruminococcus sp.]|nr:cofactor-independent phosphoglycerate mutase [Ruminococcus sp.]